MGTQFGKTNPPLQGFDDVADEAARAALVVTVDTIGKTVRQTGGLEPGEYLAIGLGSGLDKWHQLDVHFGPWSGSGLKTPTGDGTDLPVGRVSILAATAVGDPGDPDYNLPDSSINPPRLGEAIPVFFVMTQPGETATVYLQGTDMFLGSGALSDAVTEKTTVRFYVFLGNLGGLLPFNAWLIAEQPTPGIASAVNPEGHGLILRTDWMTEEPLPSFTPNLIGDGDPGSTLVADANGALTINGTAIGLNSTVLVASEDGANRRYHGPYTVTQTGDGSNPWILELLAPWGQGNVWGAGLIYVDGPGTDQRQRGVLVSFFGKADIRPGGGTEKDAIRTTRPHHTFQVQWMQRAPLPAYTVTGTGHAKRLTANANGAFDLDSSGTPITPNQWSRIAVTNQAVAADHGVYVLEQVGDGSNPWILRVAWDWAGIDQHGLGAIIYATEDGGTFAPGGATYYMEREASALRTKPLNLSLLQDFSGGGARTETARPFAVHQLLPGAGNTITPPSNPYAGMRFGVEVLAPAPDIEPGLQTVPGVGLSGEIFARGVRAGGWRAVWVYGNGATWDLTELSGIERGVCARHETREALTVGAVLSRLLAFTTDASDNSKVFEVEIDARGIDDSTGADALHIHRKILVRRNAAGALSVDNDTPLVNYAAGTVAGATVGVTFGGGGGNDIEANVTGVGGVTIRWRVDVEIRGGW